jgi:hypothetical protein
MPKSSNPLDINWKTWKREVRNIVVTKNRRKVRERLK